MQNRDRILRVLSPSAWRAWVRFWEEIRERAGREPHPTPGEFSWDGIASILTTSCYEYEQTRLQWFVNTEGVSLLYTSSRQRSEPSVCVTYPFFFTGSKPWRVDHDFVGRGGVDGLLNHIFDSARRPHAYQYTEDEALAYVLYLFFE